MVRKTTFGVLFVIAMFGAWRLAESLLVQTGLSEYRYLIGGLVFAVGGWISYRLVNQPRFADFLISVEAELNKVSWPTRTELIRSAVVVIVMIFVLAFVLFFFDLLWQNVFTWLGVLQSPGTEN